MNSVVAAVAAELKRGRPRPWNHPEGTAAEDQWEADVEAVAEAFAGLGLDRQAFLLEVRS
jgi:hypothetical protein